MAGLRPRLSGWILLEAVHGIDSIRFQRVTNHLGYETGIDAVRHTPSVMQDILKLIPWSCFERLVEEHGADERARRFSSRHQLIALLYGQLGGATSLRDIESTMESHKACLYHLGAVVPPRSTFADANRSRDWRVFSGMFEHMLGKAARALRRRFGSEVTNAVHLIDSTSLRLAGMGTEWARFSADVCGAKAHFIYDPDLARPVYHAVTAANVNDITAAKDMPIEPGATYVFDLGYYDYGWWARLDRAGCRFVTRFKANTPLHEPNDLPLPPGSCALSDRIGHLPARQAASRRNPMSDPVREVVVMTETGKKLRLLTNDLDAPAQEIADLYKRRWQIELFFRLMKQTLRITHFLGRSENAVRIQIAVALIAFLLLHQLRQISKGVRSHLELVRLVRANLMHRKDMTRLKQAQCSPPIDSRQLSLNLAAT